MKYIENIFKFFVTALILISISVPVWAVTIPAHTNDFYVNDFAKIFTQEEQVQLVSKAVTFAEQHNGVQVVITTVESLEGEPLENYALNMYNTYEIGKDDMGVLILLSVNDRDVRMQTGIAMEKYLTASKCR